ncbi:receptor activity-modifying protein 3-like [Protopterus annectens]|uniref:receptor activity-modifying protein 3-like n=1 Tax=Protopterus annectens TaxID=7888 RepID=UPI001CF95216|nr:receptor activity-modifying protein 3-like [Protopterus annectens]
MTTGHSDQNENNTSIRATESTKQNCNETVMLDNVKICGYSFELLMFHTLDRKDWCNVTSLLRQYSFFSSCTENVTIYAGCFWPNPIVEGFIIGIHKKFFSNCTYIAETMPEDPPDKILSILLLIPVLLTAAMIALVVWCSRRSDILV